MDNSALSCYEVITFMYVFIILYTCFGFGDIKNPRKMTLTRILRGKLFGCFPGEITCQGNLSLKYSTWIRSVKSARIPAWIRQ